MNQSELDALLAQKRPVPVSTESLQASYDYLVSLQKAVEVDLDELKANLDTLGRLKDRLSDSALEAVGKALQSVVDRADFPDKLRGRVESFKRVTWGLFSDNDPIEEIIKKAIDWLDDRELAASAAQWLKDNHALLAPAPIVPPEKLSLS